MADWTRLVELARRLWARKLVHWVAGYVTGAFAVYGAALDLEGRGFLPYWLPDLIEPWLVAGLFATLVLAWFHGERGRQRVTGFEGVLLGTIVLGTLLLARPGPPLQRIEGVRSLHIQPHETSITTAEERELAQRAATLLHHCLQGWQGLQVTSPYAVAGISFDLGLKGTVRSEIDESLAVARRMQVETLATVQAEMLGAEALITVALYDVGTGRQLRDPVTTRGDPRDLESLVIPIAQSILDLGGAPSGILLKRESTSLQAVQEYVDGVRHLERWELPSAEAAFRRALEADPLLSRAHRDLALTLYWAAAEAPDRWDALEPDIALHSAAAVSPGATLPHRDSLHALALRALVTERHRDARELYRGLTDSESTDVVAWLMLGATEFTDRSTIQDSTGYIRPRGSLKVAEASFRRAVELNPQFYLGYGYLFDLVMGLTGADRRCHPGAQGFRPPGAPEGPGFEMAAPHQLLWFCAVAPDSLHWHPMESLDSLDPSMLGSAFDQHFERALALITEWSRYAESSSRPWEERADWLLERRDRGAGTPRAWMADSLANEALESGLRALALIRDTTPELTLRIGSLYLAAGNPAAARAYAAAGIQAMKARDGDAFDPPDEVVNVALASGRLDEAVSLAHAGGAGQMEFPNPSSGGRRLLVAADAEVLTLRVHGALGYGPEVSRLLEEVRRRWALQGYSEEERLLLKQALARPWFVLGLLPDSASLRAWFSGVDVPLWLSPVLAPAGERGMRLEEALADHAESPPSALRAYVLLRAAAGQARHGDVIRLAREILATPIPVRAMDLRWGVANLARLELARSLEASGDPEAREHYRILAQMWRGADLERLPLSEAESAALKELSSN